MVKSISGDIRGTKLKVDERDMIGTACPGLLLFIIVIRRILLMLKIARGR